MPSFSTGYCLNTPRHPVSSNYIIDNIQNMYRPPKASADRSSGSISSNSSSSLIARPLLDISALNDSTTSTNFLKPSLPHNSHMNKAGERPAKYKYIRPLPPIPRDIKQPLPGPAEHIRPRRLPAPPLPITSFPTGEHASGIIS